MVFGPFSRGSGSEVEHLLPKEKGAGSNPASRSRGDAEWCEECQRYIAGKEWHEHHRPPRTLRFPWTSAPSGEVKLTEEVADPEEAKMLVETLQEGGKIVGHEYTTDEAKIYVLGALVDRLREQNRTLQRLCTVQIGEWQRLRAVGAIWKRRLVEVGMQHGITSEEIADPTEEEIEAEIGRGGVG